MNRLILVLIPALFLSGPVWSETFTGEDLLTNPNVSFPTVQPVLDGTSIVFGPGQPAWAKLLVFQLTGSDLNPDEAYTVTLTLNLTRLTNDWDPYLLLGDGTQLLGPVVVDNADYLHVSRLMDNGDSGTGNTVEGVLLEAPVPPVGSSFDVRITYTIMPTATHISGLFEGVSGEFTSGTILDRSAGIDFVLMSDNESGEIYKLNTLTLETTDTVGGNVTGMSPAFVVCNNRTTGQTVATLLGGDKTWDCEAEGLVVTPGDSVQMFIRGSAD